jgi:hypothetical protein
MSQMRASRQSSASYTRKGLFEIGVAAAHRLTSLIAGRAASKPRNQRQFPKTSNIEPSARAPAAHRIHLPLFVYKILSLCQVALRDDMPMPGHENVGFRETHLPV